jgi:predicted RNase H-like HicB family nuclease
MDLKYQLIITWSPADNAFIVRLPELPGCMAEGKTYQEAVRNVQLVMKEWIATAKEVGRPIPEPGGRLKFA